MLQSTLLTQESTGQSESHTALCALPRLAFLPQRTGVHTGNCMSASMPVHRMKLSPSLTLALIPALLHALHLLLCILHYSTSVGCLQDDADCRMALPLTWGIMIVHFFVYSILAVYLSAVLPDASGVRDPPHFFLLPSYWRPRLYKSTTINTAQLTAPSVRQVDEDVAAEAAKMRDRLQANGGHISQTGSVPSDSSAHNGTSAPAIEVYGLQRRFGHGSDAFWAVCDSWFEIPKQQLFCLLGPNGAGERSCVPAIETLT